MHSPIPRSSLVERRPIVFRMLFALLIAGLCPLLAFAQSDDGAGFPESWQNARELIRGHLEIGVRSQHFTLQEESKRSFNDDGSFKEGFIQRTSVDRLDAEQQYFPYPFVRVILGDFFALSLAYEQARAKTLTYYQPGTGYDGHTDGTLEIAGPALYFELRYPNETPLVPFAQFGLIQYSADFENDPGWSAGGYRQWRVDDTRGTRWVLGLQWQINEQWGVEGFVARTEVDVDAAFYLAGNKRASGTFPMSHDSIGLAAHYRF
jgi:hypothetical protein